MIDEAEMCRRAGIKSYMLREWIQADWIHPRSDLMGASFSDIDLARARLIRDLAGPMGVNEEGVAVILSLLDQIHGLRRALRRMNSAVVAQDAAVRRRIRYEASKIP